MLYLEITVSVAFVLVSFAIDSAENVPIIQQYTQPFNSKLDPVSETIGSELHHLPHQRRLVASLILAGDLTPPTDPTRSHHKPPTLATARNNEKSAPVRGKPNSSQHPKRHEDGKHAQRSGEANSNPKLGKLTDQTSPSDAKRNTEAVRKLSNTTKTVIGHESSSKKTEKSFAGTRTGKELVNTPPSKLLPSSPKPRETTPSPSLNPHEGILHLSHKFAELFPRGLIAALNAQTRAQASHYPLRITPGEVVQKIPSEKSREEESEAVSNVQKIGRKSTEDPDETLIEVYSIEDEVERTENDVHRILDELNRSLNLDELLGKKARAPNPKDGIKRSGVTLNGPIDLDELLTTKHKVPFGRDDDSDQQERMSNDMIVEKIEEEMVELDENMKSNETDSEAKDDAEDEDTASIMHKLRHTDVFAIIYLGGFIGLVTFFFILACSEIFCQNCLYRSSSNLFLPQAHCTHSYYTTPKPVTPPPPYHLFAPPPYIDIAKAFNSVNQTGKTVSHTILHAERDKASGNGAPCVCPGTPCPAYSREGVPEGSPTTPLVSIISIEDQPCPPYQGTPNTLHKTINSTSVHVENERDKTAGFQQYETVKRPGESIYEVHQIPSKPIPCPCKYDGTTDTIIKSSPNTGEHMVRHCVSFIECSDTRQVNTYTFKNSVSFSDQTGFTSSTESKLNEIDNRRALANFLRENRQFKNQLQTRIRNSLSFTSNHSVEIDDPGVKHSVSYAEHMDNACRTLDELDCKGHLEKKHCRSCVAISSFHSSIPEFRSMPIDEPLVDISNVHAHKSHQRTETGGDNCSNKADPHQGTERGVHISNQNDVDIRNQTKSLNKETMTGNVLHQSTENGVDTGKTMKEPLAGNLLNASLITLDKDATEHTNIGRDDSNHSKLKTDMHMNKTRESRDVSTNTCQGFINQMDSIAETNTFVNQMEHLAERKVDCMNSSVDTALIESTQSTERPLDHHNTLGAERTLIDHSTSVNDTHMKSSQMSSSEDYMKDTKDLMKHSNSSHMNSGTGHCALESGEDNGNRPGLSLGKTEHGFCSTGILCTGETEGSEHRSNSAGISDAEDKASADGKRRKTKIFFIDDLDDEDFS